MNIFTNSINYLNNNLKKQVVAIESGDDKLLDEIWIDQANFLKFLAPSIHLNI